MSTPDVLFKVGISLTAIDWMEEHMRELEKQDFARTWGTVRKGLIASIYLSDSLGTATLDGEVMGLFGVARDQGEGHQPWLALTEEALRHSAKIVRCMKDWVGTYLIEYGYLANLVPVADEVAIDLLEVVGFTVDRAKLFYRRDEPYYSFFAIEESD